MPVLNTTRTRAPQQVYRPGILWAKIRHACFFIKPLDGFSHQTDQTTHACLEPTRLPPIIPADDQGPIKTHDLVPSSWRIQTKAQSIFRKTDANLCLLKSKYREMKVIPGEKQKFRVPLREYGSIYTSKMMREDIDCSLAGNRKVISSGRGRIVDIPDSDISRNRVELLNFKPLTCETPLQMRPHLSHRRAAETDGPAFGIPIDPITPPTANVPTAAIAGGVVAGVLVIVVFISLGLFWRRRQKKKHQPQIDAHEGKPEETELSLVVAAFGDSVQFASIEERLEEGRMAEGAKGEGEESRSAEGDNMRLAAEEDNEGGRIEEHDLSWKHGDEIKGCTDG